MMTRLEFKQTLPISIDQAWVFFSDPANLSAITPVEMNFQITSQIPEIIYPGMFITYRVSPFAGIRVNWVTEITVIEPYKMFIDEQRIGPYQIWHHEHHFLAVENGTEMTDIVYYQILPGWIGNIIDYLFVRNRVLGIFEFRKRKLETIFSS